MRFLIKIVQIPQLIYIVHKPCSLLVGLQFQFRPDVVPQWQAEQWQAEQRQAEQRQADIKEKE